MHLSQPHPPLLTWCQQTWFRSRMFSSCPASLFTLLRKANGKLQKMSGLSTLDIVRMMGCCVDTGLPHWRRPQWCHMIACTLSSSILHHGFYNFISHQTDWELQLCERNSECMMYKLACLCWWVFQRLTKTETKAEQGRLWMWRPLCVCVCVCVCTCTCVRVSSLYDVNWM